MSWHAHLIECSYAFGVQFDRIHAGEPARYGSAYHELIANDTLCNEDASIEPLAPLEVAKKWNVEKYVEELVTHVQAGFQELQRWLSHNPFRIDFKKALKGGVSLFVETALALRPLESARFIQPHAKDHIYRGLRLGDLPGTLDYAQVARLRGKPTWPLLLLDHKTGAEDFSRPLDKPQLLSLAAAMMRLTGVHEAIVGAAHARRRGLPKIYAEKVKLSELKAYETRLANAAGRIGDGSMRPGPWCTRCPAASACPARDSDLLSRAGDVLTGLTAAGGALSQAGLAANDVAIIKSPSAAMTVERKLGLLYSVVQKAEALSARARAEIRSAILADPDLLPETPEDRYLVVRTFEKESLSKQSILDAYGPLAGERLLAKLRKDGAIKKSRVDQLWLEKDRGS